MKNRNKRILIALSVLTVSLWGAVLLVGIGNTNVSNGTITVIETPDRTESTEHPLFVKEEYEPIIPEGTNIAENAKIEANGNNDVYFPARVNDGNPNARSYWEGASDSYPNILTASFKEEQNVHAIKLLLCPLSVWSTRTQTFGVEISEDGENFTELLPYKDYVFDPDKGNEVVLEFDEVSIMAIRFTFTSNTGASGAQVAELEIYSR